jgi:hypothetical protein
MKLIPIPGWCSSVENTLSLHVLGLIIHGKPE